MIKGMDGEFHWRASSESAMTRPFESLSLCRLLWIAWPLPALPVHE
jgi:hypothetical protein